MVGTISVLESRAKQNKVIEKLLRQQKKAADINWLPWQKELKSEPDGEPHDRKITFYVDYEVIMHIHIYIPLTQSNEQWKDRQLRYFVAKHNIRCVIFDLTRHTLGNINWQFVEELKDGKFVSHKYDCKMVTCEQTPHIVCMMNNNPDTKC